MPANRQRLDRFLSTTLGINRKEVKSLLAQNRVVVDELYPTNIDQLVDTFSVISFDDKLLQNNEPVYLMLNKPAGVLSATKDTRHPTVIDLLDHPARKDLHIVGRLDRNSTGLLLLTNDGRWSKALMAPEKKVEKVYLVKLKNPVTTDYIAAFAKGMYFPFEDITTQPAKLEIISETTTQVTLMEGRYHQLKRMYGRFRNPVLGLHRISIGNVVLDPSLAPGQSRTLSIQEITSTQVTSDVTSSN